MFSSSTKITISSTVASVPTYHFQLTSKSYTTCTLLRKLYDFALGGKKKIYKYTFTTSSCYQKTDTQPWVNISMSFYNDSKGSSLVNRTRKDNVKNEKKICKMFLLKDPSYYRN